jgi:hypothetical protein
VVISIFIPIIVVPVNEWEYTNVPRKSRLLRKLAAVFAGIAFVALLTPAHFLSGRWGSGLVIETAIIGACVIAAGACLRFSD